MKKSVELNDSQLFYDKFYSRPHKVDHYYGNNRFLGKPGRVLDVACGDGYFLSFLSPQFEKYGIDLSPVAIEVAKTRVRADRLYIGCAELLPFPNSFFDYVHCWGSIEHFVDMEKALSEMWRVGKPDCRFIFTVPNSCLNYNFFKTGKIHTWQEENKEELHSLKEWKAIFEKAGFKVIQVAPDRELKKKWVGLKLLILKLIPLRFAYQFAFVLQK